MRLIIVGMFLLTVGMFLLTLWASHEAFTSVKQPENTFICLDGVRTYRFPSPNDEWECD